ncbi:immunoglobulin domain-containing protein [Cytophagaceae bacterium ABcell3]|nr:immunoglobulin domain-containing protein [Cytophagaceae bacterium ABcell3]
MLLLCLSVGFTSAKAQNLINNGDFEDGFTDWQNLSDGTSSVNFFHETTDTHTGSGAMRVEVIQPGTEAWDAQSIHVGWASVSGQEYTLTFWAKTISSNSSVRIVQQNTSYASRDFDITTEWQQFSWTFVANESNLQLKIHYTDEGTFIFDDFFIEDPLASSTGPRALNVDISEKHQTMVGFGGALTWHCDRITRSARKDEMTQLLFDDLGADMIRFKSWYYPENYPSNKSPQAMEVNWFEPHYTATNELAALAKKYNPNVDLLLCSWGPPSSLKSNDQLEEGTLKKVDGQFIYNEYAEYWSDILDNLPFDPEYISIQNEPGYEDPGWTTTGWRPEETDEYPSYAQGLESVYEKIKDRPYVPKMIGPETENIGVALWDHSQNTYRSMTETVEGKPYLEAYAYHLYNFSSPNNINIDLLNMVRDEFTDKPNFMTEFSSDNYDWLETAHMIQLNLIEANTSAYIYWDMMWDENNDKAMIKVDTQGDYEITPYYHTVKHFSKFVDKGYQRIAIGGGTSTLKVTGFLSPDNTKATFILSNLSDSPETLALEFEDLILGETNAYQSTEGSYFNELGSVNLEEEVEVPGKSLTTITVELETENNVDCNGDPEGTAEVDECDVCAGGNTGIEPGETCKAPIIESISSTHVEIAEGESTTLEVTASGPESITYQWFRNGNLIDGATASSYTIENADTNDAGTYHVEVYNNDISTRSDDIEVVVNTASQEIDCNGDADGSADLDECGICAGGNTGIEPGALCPVITSITSDMEVTIGEPFSLDVSVTGSGSFTYQWYKDDEPIEGATNSTYAQEEATEDDAGIYYVVIRSSNGAETQSTPFEITTSEPLDCHGTPGGDAYEDVCGNCVSGETGAEAVENEEDCVTSVNLSEKGKFNIYPNPATSELYVEYRKAGSKRFAIYNSLGSLVLEANGNNIVERLDVSKLPTGIYHLILHSGDEAKQAKFVIQ